MAAAPALGALVSLHWPAPFPWERIHSRTSRPWIANSRLKPLLQYATLALLTILNSAPASAADYFLIVRGLGGETEYDKRFSEQAQAIAESARKVAGAERRVSVLAGAQATREAIKQAFARLAKTVTGADRLQLVLIGHGSFDGEHYKFNIPGPDLNGEELRALLDQVPTERQLIVAMTSSSGALQDVLDNGKRALITATKSGLERNAPVFGDFWAEGLGSDRADTDKNEMITAQELYDYSEDGVAKHYQGEALLASEHPRLSGTTAPDFTVARVGQLRAVTLTSDVEKLLSQRSAVEADIRELRGQRATFSEEEYFDRLQPLMIELGRLQREIDAQAGAASKEGADD